MSPKKKRTASGVITFHTHFPVSLLESEVCAADLKDDTECKRSPHQPRSTFNGVKAKKRVEASLPEPQKGTSQDFLSDSSLRRLQAKMEAENQEANRIIQPLLETENGLVKELESFFSKRDVTELRRRELLHKHWTERVWFPLQSRVEERVSSCGPMEAKRRQSLYSHYLHHCNAKGFVFLETYNLQEYNPFFLNIKKPRCFKVNTADFKDLFYPQSHKRLKDQRTAGFCEAGCKRKLPRPLSDSVASPVDTSLQASSSYPISASRKAPDEAQGKKSIWLHNIPHHICASATPDGRCHRPGCWFSRCGCREQPANLQQLQLTYE
ncbi:protein FAM228A isoform 1-T2 [Tautogolabrus adspersus]